MSSSYEKINYSLRPAKCIERKMLCETFRRLSIFGKVEAYSYIGFGSTFFSDFALFHKTLNICNMTSIEKDVAKKDRFEFNCPFRCIEIKYGNSHEIIPNINWDTRSILWLDYDSRLTKNVLLDINSFCANAIPASLIIISVNVEPEKNMNIPYDDIPNYRLEQLRKEVGGVRFPKDLRGKELAKWGTAKVCRRIIYNEIMQTLNGRNGIRKKGNKFCYKQLFNFHYSDNAKMLTTGGLLYDEGQEHLIDQCAFNDLSFVRQNDEPYHIEVPSLTFKEIRHINEQLPKKSGQQLVAPAVRSTDIDKYEKIYRYFPAFTEANL
jgi:putative O-methyltransferase